MPSTPTCPVPKIHAQQHLIYSLLSFFGFLGSAGAAPRSCSVGCESALSAFMLTGSPSADGFVLSLSSASSLSDFLPLCCHPSAFCFVCEGVECMRWALTSFPPLLFGLSCSVGSVLLFSAFRLTGSPSAEGFFSSFSFASCGSGFLSCLY